MERGRHTYEWRNCSCGRRGRICVCAPRNSMDPMLIHVMNESRRLRVIDELRAELDKDLLGVDAKWVLFGMAIQSYRYEQLLVPYPPAYCTPAGFNINSLSYVAGTMSELASFQRRLLQNVLPPEQVELLHWLLIQSGTPQLRQLQRNDQLLLWRQLEQKPEPRPHLVFRVQQRNQDSEPVEPLDVTNCVYFCGDMEELYALIAAGSHDISSSELEFYDDLEQACSMAEWCPGWGYSICGTLLRSIAVCQLRQASPELPQLLQVRYLLIYSMNYTQKMQGYLLARMCWGMPRAYHSSCRHFQSLLLVEARMSI
ncbi:protein mono-ADP-ribosyltransferase PARP16-like [Drosophila novamexicana]|uniref:protein mono-ADP-ribosyltransferase PARP16-like n=1 Tax=Drosophila novamexicana TaxID=47314 RepID=UPI0011E5FAEB|nr:protein mono-ADP-ribosyltransferase PARP16-like [Drosophila novamexicana]